MSDKKNTDTTLVTAGRKKEWTHGIVNPPVYRASTILFDTYADVRAGVADPTPPTMFYGRKGTPTHWALMDAITELEGGAGTMLYPSGEAAVTGAIMAFVKSGDHVLLTDSSYEPTRSFANGFLKQMGATAEYFDPLIGEGIESLIKDNTSVIVLESPGSLTFEVQDIPAICAVAKKHDITVIVDSTWATPLLLDTLGLGADVVVHACTKYIGGHSDLMMGSATANERSFKQLRRIAYQLGFIVSADDASLALRSLHTLSVRLKVHEENALKVAKFLESHDEVETILHPAFPSCPGHDIWKRDFKGSCGLFSFTLKRGDYADTAAMVDHMKLFKMGFSWGGYESLIMPSDPRGSRTATKWEAKGPVIRLHIGLEDTDDLIADLSEGLARYKAHMDTA